MKILGIDTSSKFLSVALSKDGKITIERSFLLDRRHSSELLPKIKDILENANLSIEEIDRFVVGLGPGSFTGLRIGVSTIKGFGIATKKPCIGVPSIDSLALNADSKVEGLIIPIIDAKRNQVYSAIYKKGQKDNILRKSGYLLLDIDSLMEKVKGPLLFLGDGVSLYGEKIKGLNKHAVFLEEDYWFPKAGNLIKLALKKAKIGKHATLDRLKPMYLYPKDCQVRR